MGEKQKEIGFTMKAFLNASAGNHAFKIVTITKYDRAAKDVVYTTDEQETGTVSFDQIGWIRCERDCRSNS